MPASESSAPDLKPAAPKGSPVKKAIAECLVVTLIAAAAGVASATLSGSPSPALSPAAPRASASAAVPTCGAVASNLLDLPPIVTNIGAPADTWVRMEASIVFDAKTTPHPEIVAAEIATDELAYLRTITLAQLQGPIGLENIRQDLTDRAVIRSGGKVSELVLRTLVAQ
jgi:flagellar protein FliL